MSFTTLAIVTSALTSIEEALRDSREVDVGILGSFNAALSHLLLSGREPMASEVEALQQLSAALVDETPSEELSEGTAGASVISPPAAPAEPTSAPVAPEAAGDAGASQASVMPVAGEAAASLAPAATENRDALFQEQSPGEDDGA